MSHCVNIEAKTSSLIYKFEVFSNYMQINVNPNFKENTLYIFS